MFVPNMCVCVCVCVNQLQRCVISNLLEFRYSFHCISYLPGGNLMFAADCPTKRDAFMTHVPAFSIQFCRFHFNENGSRLSPEPA